MSRKACKRRHYPLVNVISLAITGCSISSEDDLDKLRLRELSAIESFAKGTATPNEFRDLADMLNLAETMANMGIGPEALEACAAAQSALLAAKVRHDKLGRLGMTGEGLQSLRDLYAYHDAQRMAVDRSQYERAISKTRDRIRSAHPSIKELT